MANPRHVSMIENAMAQFHRDLQKDPEVLTPGVTPSGTPFATPREGFVTPHSGMMPLEVPPLMIELLFDGFAHSAAPWL